MTKQDEQQLINTMTQVVETLKEVNKSHNKSPWGTLGTWAAVVIVAISSIGTLAVSPMWDSIAENKALDIRQQQQIDNTRIQLAKLEAVKEK